MNNKFDIKKKLGKRIQTLRKHKKITQENFAEKINIEPQSLSNIECGKFAPSIETLQKIAYILEVEPYELYLFDNIPPIEIMKEELISAIKRSDALTLELYKVFDLSRKNTLSIKN